MERLQAVEREPDCCDLCTDRARYARKLADRMQLRDWVIEIAHDPPGDIYAGARATCEIAEGRKLLRLRFAADFHELESPEQRHAFVHELCHPLLNPLFQTVRHGAQDEFGGAAFRLFMGAVERDLEHSIDSFASIIAPTMPEPTG